MNEALFDLLRDLSPEGTGTNPTVTLDLTGGQRLVGRVLFAHERVVRFATNPGHGKLRREHAVPLAHIVDVSWAVAA